MLLFSKGAESKKERIQLPHIFSPVIKDLFGLQWSSPKANKTNGKLKENPQKAGET